MFNSVRKVVRTKGHHAWTKKKGIPHACPYPAGPAHQLSDSLRLRVHPTAAYHQSCHHTHTCRHVARGRRLLGTMAIASRQHPLLLWLEGAGFQGSLSLGAYHLLLCLCLWFVLRRGRAWARSRSILAGNSKASEGSEGVFAGDKPPQLSYVDSPRHRRLLAKTTLLARPYKPSPWLGHRVRI